METQVVLVTLVLLESLDPLEKLVLKDHEAVMANPVHLEEGEQLVYPVILDLMELKEMLALPDQMDLLAIVEHLEDLDQMVQVEHKAKRVPAEHGVYQAPRELLATKDQQDYRVPQVQLEHQEQQEGKELMDQLVIPVFKDSLEQGAPRVKLE